MNDLELKRARIEKWAKIIGLGVFSFLFAPFAIMTIKGLIALIVVLSIGGLVTQVGIPWASVTLANWRLAAIKAAVAANPIETLENEGQAKQEALDGFRTSIQQFGQIVDEMGQEISDYEEQYKTRHALHDQYLRMVELYNLRSKKYVDMSKKLAEYWDMVARKRREWKTVQILNKAQSLAKVGQDFMSQLMQDTAIQKIQSDLNFQLADLKTSLLDEQAASQIEAAKAPPIRAEVVEDDVEPKNITQRSSVPRIDLNLPTLNAEPVPVEATSKARNHR